LSNASPRSNDIEAYGASGSPPEEGLAQPLSPLEVLFPELRHLSTDDLRQIGITKPTVMIAMTARTGSSHLCSGLASVIRAGKPRELFNTRSNKTPDQKRRGAKTMGEFLAQYAAASEDCVVFKTSWLDFEYFQDKIQLLFPNLKVVYLDRFDIEAQAVSLYRAILSGYWHDSPDKAAPPKRGIDEIRNLFDVRKICHIIDTLSHEKWMWEDYLFRHDLRPIRIYYEHFSDDLREVVARIVRHLDVPHGSLDGLASTFKAVSDEVNQDWILKLRRYRNGTLTRDHLLETTPGDTAFS